VCYHYKGYTIIFTTTLMGNSYGMVLLLPQTIPSIYQ
jgi:hypothetical protein